MTPQSEKLLAGLKGESADERYTAWVSASGADPEVIPELARLLEAPEPGVRKAADEALKKLVHSVGKETRGKRHARVVEGLLALTGPKQPKWVRTVALRHLSTIAGDDAVPAVAKMLREPEMQEEAVFCLERIPGSASEKAILAAYADVKEDFKPRILAALGHRRTEAAAPLCAAAISSSNTELALAGMKTLGRIGRDPGTKPRAPNYESLTEWQKTEYADSVLRYADAMVEIGRPGEAIPMYKLALSRPGEHLQCAAIIGLSKIRTPEATALIESKLQGSHRNVRITAEKALAAVKKG